MKIIAQQPLTKVHLRSLIKKYINHREWLYDHCKAYKTAEHIQAICKIKTRLAYNEKADLATHCKMVVNLEFELRQILPGATSKFYCGRAEMLEKLISDCKAFLYGSH